MTKVVGIGEILWDLFTDGAVLGGAPGNFAMHSNSLGLNGYVVSTIGRDERGEEVKKIFKERGLKSFITEVSEPTGTVKVTLDSEGKATYDFTEDSAWDHITLSEKSTKLAKECDAVCFGSLAQRSEISRKSIHSFLKLTRESCIRIFDINIRLNFYSKEIIDESLKLATVLKLNDEELPLIMEIYGLANDESESLEQIKSMFNLDLIILTKGGDGSLLYRSKNEQSFAVPGKTKIVDTVGAGDSFTAAVVVGLLKNKSLDEINFEANRVAAFVCTQKGATPSLDEIL